MSTKPGKRAMRRKRKFGEPIGYTLTIRSASFEFDGVTQYCENQSEEPVYKNAHEAQSARDKSRRAYHKFFQNMRT